MSWGAYLILIFLLIWLDFRIAKLEDYLQIKGEEE